MKREGITPFHLPSREAVFDFLIPATVLAILARLWPGIPWVIGDTLFTLALVAWIFFAIHDRRHRRKSSAKDEKRTTGVNAKALSVFMGHAKIGITLDRYGHLMPGSEAASLLDSYLDAERKGAEDAARSAGAVAV